MRKTSSLLAIRAAFALRYHIIVYIPTAPLSFGYVAEDMILFLVEGLTYLIIFNVALGQGRISDGKAKDQADRKTEGEGDGKAKDDAKEEVLQKLDVIV